MKEPKYGPYTPKTIADWEAHKQKNMEDAKPALEHLMELASRKSIPVSLPKELLQRLGVVGDECCTSINDLIELAIERYITPEESNKGSAQLPPTPEQEAFQAFRMKWFQYESHLCLVDTFNVLQSLSPAETGKRSQQCADLQRSLKLDHVQSLIFIDGFKNGYAAAFCSPLLSPKDTRNGDKK